MAKMFYTIEEAAEKLGTDVDGIKDMVTEGKVQQFRDRDKLMFKRDEVDSLSGSSDSGELIPLADTGETDAIDLSADDSVAAFGLEDSREATGVSVFDTGETDAVDPLAQTQVTSDNEEIALETVGSGSGLLDLTREADDTSLGAELLDDLGSVAGGSVSASGIFDSAVAMEPEGTSIASGTSFGGLDSGDSVVGGPATPLAVATYEDESDPAGSGLAAGFMIGSLAALIVGMIVIFNAIAGASGGLISTIVGDGGNSTGIFIWSGGLFAACVIFGVIGMFVGKAAAK